VNGSKHTIKKDTHALVVTSKDIGMKVKAEKTEYSICGHVSRAAHRTTAQQHNKRQVINSLKGWNTSNILE